jgi:hypothetical protein
LRRAPCIHAHPFCELRSYGTPVDVGAWQVSGC